MTEQEKEDAIIAGFKAIKKALAKPDGYLRQENILTFEVEKSGTDALDLIGVKYSLVCGVVAIVKEEYMKMVEIARSKGC